MKFAVPEERIGGGRVYTVTALMNGKKQRVAARVGLFGSDIGVIIKGREWGRLIVPRWDWVLIESLKEQNLLKRFDPHWRTYVMYDNVYAVARYTREVSWQYGLSFREGRKGQLFQAQQALIALNQLALGLRKGNADQLLSEFQKRSGVVIRQIGSRPRVYRNKRILNAARRLSSVRDSLDRINSGAAAAVAVGARDQASQRLIDISRIEQTLVARRQTAHMLIEVMESHFQVMFDLLCLSMPLRDMADQLRRDRLRRDALISSLDFYVGALAAYDVVPFRFTAQHLMEEFAQVSEMIRSRRYDDAVKVLRTSWNSLVLRRVRTDIEHIVTDVSSYVIRQLRAERKQYDAFIFRIRKCIEQLSGVDESGFQHPVAQKVNEHLNIAVTFLLLKDRPALKQAKEALKSAAKLL